MIILSDGMMKAAEFAGVVASDGYAILSSVGNSEYSEVITAMMQGLKEVIVDSFLSFLQSSIGSWLVVFAVLYLLEIGVDIFLYFVGMNRADVSDFDGMGAAGRYDDFDEEWNRQIMTDLGYDQDDD